MFRRGISFMVAGVLTATGLDLVASFVAVLGLLWLAGELADSWVAL
jgi:hypothetical protein